MVSDLSTNTEFLHISLTWKCEGFQTIKYISSAIEDDTHLMTFYNHEIQRKEIFQLTFFFINFIIIYMIQIK